MNSEESEQDSLSGSSCKEREINILSFDGGGSKGIMEVFILKDVFNFLTILQRDSEKLKFLLKQEMSLNTKVGRKKLRSLLDTCKNPIHPTAAFDFIVGTSVGSLIAFGLVGGKKNGQERTPMQVEEIIQMFKDSTKMMFVKKAATSCIACLKGKAEGLFLPFPAIPYSQDGLEKILSERFGDVYLGGFPRPNGCVAGAVAKRIFRDTGVAGNEVLFTTGGLNDMYKVVEVLKASSAAPIYFETPAMIGDEAFIDGGDGGNCPLAQALEAIPEIFGEQVKVTSVLSIAPPETFIGRIPEERQWMYWLSYFPSQVTDGAAVYNCVTRSHRSINSQRLFPKSEEAKKFKLDEKNVEAMISCMETESIEDEPYFIDVLRAALTINLRLQKSKNDVAFRLCQHLFKESKNAKSNLELDFARLCLDIAEHNGASSLEIAKIKQQLGDCYFDEVQYDKAIAYYEESLDGAGQKLQSDDVAILNNKIGSCYMEKARYDKAREYFQKPEQMILKETEQLSPLVVAETYINLGGCELERENFKAAIDYYEKSLKPLQISQSGHTESEASSYLAHSYKGLGSCYLKKEEFQKAKDYYMKSKNQEIDDDKFKSKLLNNEALCLLIIDEVEDAIDGFNESLRMKERIYDQMHHSVAASHTNLGNCYMKKKDYDEAIDSYRTSHQMNTQIFGKDSAIPSMAETHNNLGICFLNLQEKSIDEAHSSFVKSLEIKRRVYGEDKPNKSIAITYNNLGKTMMEKAEYDEAVTYYNKSLQIKIEIYGDDPSRSSIAISYQNLGDCYKAMGDEKNASSCYEKIKNMKVDPEELLEGDFFL